MSAILDCGVPGCKKLVVQNTREGGFRCEQHQITSGMELSCACRNPGVPKMLNGQKFLDAKGIDHSPTQCGPSFMRDKPAGANSRQVGGTHYRDGNSIQPWDFVLANGLGFLEGNAIKYISRHRKTPTGKQDLEKAIHYLQKAIEFYYDPKKG